MAARNVAPGGSHRWTGTARLPVSDPCTPSSGDADVVPVAAVEVDLVAAGLARGVVADVGVEREMLPGQLLRGFGRAGCGRATVAVSTLVTLRNHVGVWDRRR